MKIIIKSLSGQQFTVEAESANTILQLKEKIFEIKKHEVAQQKLLRKGQLLNDNQTIEELGITESDFLVVMVNAKKPQQQPPAQVPVQAQQPPVQQPPVQPPVQQPSSQQPTTLQPAQQTNPGPASSSFVSGPEFDKTIEELMSMGFSKEECVTAMRAAYNNPERAAEYLINGIPANLTHHTRPLPNVTVPPQPSTEPQTQAPQNPLLGPQAGGPFAQLRQSYQQNPQAIIGLLPQLMQQIQQTNPQLHAQLQQHPEMLLQLISGNLGPQAPSRQIQLSPQEMSDIETIMSLGFSKQDSLEGYLACDKNIEAAINYLFERQANGDLMSQHIQRERANPQNQQPPLPPSGGEQGPHEEDEQEDDDDVYQ